MSHRRFVPRTLAALLAVAAFAGASVATLPAVAHAAHITKAQAQRAAKRAASRRVARLGLNYPPSTWKADCRPAAGAWRCNAEPAGSARPTSSWAEPRGGPSRACATCAASDDLARGRSARVSRRRTLAWSRQGRDSSRAHPWVLAMSPPGPDALRRRAARAAERAARQAETRRRRPGGYLRCQRSTTRTPGSGSPAAWP